MVVFDSHSIGKLVVFPHETFLAHIDVVAGYPERCTPFYTKARTKREESTELFPSLLCTKLIPSISDGTHY